MFIKPYSNKTNMEIVAHRGLVQDNIKENSKTLKEMIDEVSNSINCAESHIGRLTEQKRNNYLMEKRKEYQTIHNNAAEKPLIMTGSIVNFEFLFYSKYFALSYFNFTIDT